MNLIVLSVKYTNYLIKDFIFELFEILMINVNYGSESRSLNFRQQQNWRNRAATTPSIWDHRSSLISSCCPSSCCGRTI
jgi:hypothetical protein